jgi:hypothetical protein
LPLKFFAPRSAFGLFSQPSILAACNAYLPMPVIPNETQSMGKYGYSFSVCFSVETIYFILPNI